MKKLITAGCIILLAACSSTNDFDADLDSKVSKPSSPNQASTPQPNSTAMPMPVNSQPVNSQLVTTPPATTTIQTQPVATAPGMNPPHGEPGHRCDIAVGAPLNSAPKTAAQTATGQNVVITPTPVKTATGMNPPHGQPGHRCDIAVGAPLNSAPSTTTQVTPVKPEETKAAGADQWKVDIKDKPVSKDSSRN
jgi:hypothetical protein